MNNSIREATVKRDYAEKEFVFNPVEWAYSSNAQILPVDLRVNDELASRGGMHVCVTAITWLKNSMIFMESGTS